MTSGDDSTDEPSAHRSGGRSFVSMFGRLAIPIYVPTLAEGVGLSIVLPVLPAFLKGMGANDEVIGLVVAQRRLSLLVGSVPVGCLVGAAGDRMSIAATLLMLATLGALRCVAPSVWLFAVCGALEGYAYAGLDIAKISFTRASMPRNVLGSASAVMATVMRSSMALGPLIGAALTTWLQNDRAPFMGQAAVFLIALAVTAGATACSHLGMGCVRCSDKRCPTSADGPAESEAAAVEEGGVRAMQHGAIASSAASTTASASNSASSVSPAPSRVPTPDPAASATDGDIRASSPSVSDDRSDSNDSGSDASASDDDDDDDGRSTISASRTGHRLLLRLAPVAVPSMGLAFANGSRELLVPLAAGAAGLTPAETSGVVALSFLADALCVPLAALLMDRMGRKASGVPCLAVFACGFAALAVPGGSSHHVYAAGLLMGIGNGLGGGLQQTLSADVAPHRRRARFLGAFMTMTGVTSFFGPLAMGACAHRLSLAAAAATAAAAVGASGVWYAVRGEETLPPSRRTKVLEAMGAAMTLRSSDVESEPPRGAWLPPLRVPALGRFGGGSGAPSADGADGAAEEAQGPRAGDSQRPGPLRML
eukprot:CAMPEP_0206042852 /NCGR_PEP_ID=MMETSP1466-20131121/6800_1 /ASSEMBLY_ACC=CAM_ASM_001126 /TAXON_ID=44452 /ORGANISM="Pavlova gyrans, Strain CCMP608" /LENGTH=594 /DNA_ID=CAMNT_0053417575 /DNA_START=80 /DNA_END=1864 /DNA_ORIENTATION=+